MKLDPEQEALFARMVEGARDVDRSDQEWLLMSYGGGSLFMGPGIGREDLPEGDVLMLERAGLIMPVRYSKRDRNPTFVLTPEAKDHYAQMQGRDPSTRQESGSRKYLESRAFSSRFPRAHAKWAEADALLWRADTSNELTTVGHKAREALQDFASEAVEQFDIPDVESNPALVNKRLGAVIAAQLPGISESRAALLKALGDYWEAALAVVQRQEHGAQKEGETLCWEDARRVVFHTGCVMFELSDLLESGPADTSGARRG